MAKERSYYRNFVMMLSGNTVGQVIPLVIAPILTRLYSPDEYAVFANFAAIAGMFGIVAAGRLEVAVPIPKEKKEAQNIVYTGLLITCVITLITTVFPIFQEEVGRFYEDNAIAEQMYLIPISVLLLGLYAMSTNWVLRHKKYSALAANRILIPLANNGFSAVLGYIGWGVEGLIFGWLAGQLLGMLLLVFVIDRKIDFKEYRLPIAKKTLKEYKDFPLINSLHAFTDMFANQFILFWILSSYFGMFELGLFAMMNRYVRAPIRLVSSSVSQLFYSESADSKNNDRAMMPIFLRTVRISTLFAIPFLIVVLAAGPVLFGWYFGAEWRASGVYAQCIVLILFTSFISSPVSGTPIIFGQQRTAYLISVVGYLVSLGGLIVSGYFTADIITSLIIYGSLFSVYQLGLVFWYYRMIKVHDENLN